MKWLIGWLALGCAIAQAVEIPATIREHTITEIQLADDEDVTFVAVKPSENEVSEVTTTFGIGITCPPGRYKAIVVAIKDGKFDRTRRAVKYFDCVTSPGPGPEPPQPGPGPTPPDPPAPDVKPGPRPEAFSGAVYDEMLKIHRNKDAIKFAVAADNVLKKLDEQTKGVGPRVYDTPTSAVAAFAAEVKSQSMAAEWRPFLGWLAETGKKNAATFPSVRAVLDGVRLAGRRVSGSEQ